MFSIFHGIFSIFAIGINKHNILNEDKNNREEAKRNNWLTYTTSKDGKHLTSNGRKVCIDYVNGHEVIKDLKNGIIYHDLTQCKKDNLIAKAKEDAVSEGRTTYYLYDSKFYVKANGCDSIVCYEFDIETDHPIKKYNVNQVDFYMDMTSGNLLRITDDEALRQSCSDIPYNPKEIIETFNKRQKELRQFDKYLKDETWMKLVYYMECGHNNHIVMNSDGKITRGTISLAQRNMGL